jgi:DNA-binding FadR family transcriptional regulator
MNDRSATELPHSHTARVAEEIGRTIVSGGYPQGGLLPGDAELMEQFGVSRTVLREALRGLAAKGLIQAKARVGTRVRDQAVWNLFDPDVLTWYAHSGVDAAFLAHLGEMRLALEPQAAALAATRRTDEQLATIYDGLSRMAGSGRSREDFADGDLSFHLAIAAAADNPFLFSISTLIKVALAAVLRATSPTDDPERFARSVEWHRMIVDAIATHDAKTARAAMIVVIEDGLNNAARPIGPLP